MPRTLPVFTSELFSTRLEPEDADWLKAEAKRLKVSASYIVRQCITKSRLESQKEQKP